MLHPSRVVEPSRLRRAARLRVVVAASAVAVLLAAAAPAAAETPVCAASASWVSSPNPPQEIPGGGTDFCQFYQFAWQWFLWLASPAADASERNFEEEAAFPLLQASGVDSCSAQPPGSSLFVRTFKADDPNETFVVPERINQAGSDEATIYDQVGNVVYYEVSFDRGLCDAAASGNLPAGTTEIKTSWRVLDGQQPGYYTQQAVIPGVPEQPLTLGLVGFHLFRTTADHPEGVWMTWEHDGNAPDCLEPQSAPALGWAFTSADCAKCLATSTTGPLGCASCDFNDAKGSASLTGPPTEICRVYPDGTGPGDHKAAENVADIDSLNQQLVGPGGILPSLPAGNPMAVWANYFLVGGLWVSDPTQPADSANQRGSIQLANTTMETDYQGGFHATGTTPLRTAATNCFVCHDYVPGQTATSGLSHIFDDILGGSSATSAAAGAPVAPLAAHGRPAALSSH